MSRDVSFRKRGREFELDPRDYESDEEDTPAVLVRQDALTGDQLLRAVGAPSKICGRALGKNAKINKHCQRKPYKYGMCIVHWRKWQFANIWIKYPGYY